MTTPFVLTSLFDNESLGRIDYSSIPPQVQMELVVNDIDKKDPFYDASGNFSNVDEWPGVYSSESGDVVRIDWCIGLNIDLGRSGTVRLRWLPPTLESVKIRHGHLCGELETTLLPTGLECLLVVDNQLGGTFHVAGLPQKLTELDISTNHFEGSLDIPSLPTGIRRFAAHKNRFTGSLDLRVLPEAIEEFIVSENSFTGTVDLRAIPRSLRMICLEENDFQQDRLYINLHPNIAIITLQGNAIGQLVDADGKDLKKHDMVNY